jgi:hypothetical protein
MEKGREGKEKRARGPRLSPAQLGIRDLKGTKMEERREAFSAKAKYNVNSPSRRQQPDCKNRGNECEKGTKRV